MSDEPRAPRARRGSSWMVLLLVALTMIALAWLGAKRIRGVPYPLDLAGAWRGVLETVRATGPAALVTWAVLAVTLAAFARALRRRSDLEVGEAIAGAVVLFWGGAYVALLTLGPLGLYRTWILRALLAAAVLVALAVPGQARPRGTARPGSWIAWLALILSAPTLLALQLASPVSPFMDILPYVASVEKVVAFQFYHPFGNDAVGIWAPSRQVAGCDALFSFVALVGGMPGHLAITSLILPFAALQIFALYRMGRAVHGSLAGGMATLFLLQTFVWRRTPDGRGTALAFTVVVLGLALMYAPRRSGLRVALGGLALGIAVAVNPLIGAIGMQVASVAALVEFVDFGRGLVIRGLALAGGSFFAGPQVFIGLGQHAPIPVLLLAVGAGATLLFMIARGVGAERPPRWAWAGARFAAIVGVPLWVLWLHAQQGSEFFNDEWFGYGILLILAAGGLAVLATAVWRRPRRWPAAAIPALALELGIVDWMVGSPMRFTGSLESRSLAGEITTKMIWYWWPYWLALAAGTWFGMMARRWALGPAIAVALLIVVYPLRHLPEVVDFDARQVSLVQTWGFHLTNAARGYFGGYPDRRWVMNDDWRAIGDVLRAEIAAGRITYDTHMLYLAEASNRVEVAIASGVSVDIIAPDFNPDNVWTAGGRIRGLQERQAAFAKEPPYVLVEGGRPEQYPELAAYELIATRPQMRVHLYRRRQ